MCSEMNNKATLEKWKIPEMKLITQFDTIKGNKETKLEDGNI